MATIELNLDDQTLAHARRVAESRKLSLEAMIAELVGRLDEAPTPPIDGGVGSIIGAMSDDADLLDQIVEEAMRSREDRRIGQPLNA